MLRRPPTVNFSNNANCRAKRFQLLIASKRQIERVGGLQSARIVPQLDIRVLPQYADWLGWLFRNALYITLMVVLLIENNGHRVTMMRLLKNMRTMAPDLPDKTEQSAKFQFAIGYSYLIAANAAASYFMWSIRHP